MVLAARSSPSGAATLPASRLICSVAGLRLGNVTDDDLPKTSSLCETSSYASRLPAIYRTDGAGELPGWVLAWMQPRAVGAGKRGLGQPARHNASAATVQPEAAWAG